MKALITGGCGFIGSHLVAAFLERYDDVAIIDNKSRAVAVVPNGVRCISRNVAQALQGHVWLRTWKPDVIFHCASPVGAAAMKPETQTAWQIIRDAHAIFDFVYFTKAKVIAFSTPEVYGYEADLLDETHHLEVHLPYIARHEYPIGKLAMECMGFVHPHPFIHFIRPYIVSGPRQNPASGAVLPRFVDLAVRGKPLTIFGSGEQRRQFTHIDDLVSFCLMLVERDDLWTGKQIWNVGGPDAPITIRELAERVIQVVGQGSIIAADPAEALGNPHFTEAPEKFIDTAKARAAGWAPKKGLDEIIRDMVADARARVGVK